MARKPVATRRRASARSPGALSTCTGDGGLAEPNAALYSPRIQWARPAQMRSTGDRSSIASRSTIWMAERAWLTCESNP